MPTVLFMTPFAEWLERELGVRRWTQSMLAVYIERKQQLVSSWITEGRQPRTDACLEIARVFHIDPSDVLRAAGHLPPLTEEPQPSPVPAWLIAAFEPLTPPERRYLENEVQRTSRELMRLREENAAYGEAPPASREAPVPPPPAPKRRRSRRP